MRSFTHESHHFASGDSSPINFLDSCLSAIEAREPEVKAFEILNLDGVHEAAAESQLRWKSGTQLSSIDGMPMGIKDIIETRDMPTQNGSPIYRNHNSGRDSASVQALRAAGAIILGKTVTTEFAGPFAAKTRNPWNSAHTPGGSSSGSAAAVAAGMVPAALGTQVVGSIVRPASYCGTFAVKPSVGVVNRGGSHDGLSQSAHGVLSASLDDAWNVLREIAIRVGGDPGHQPLAQTREELARERLPRRLSLLQTAGYHQADDYGRRCLEATRTRLEHLGIEVIDAAKSEDVAELEAAVSDAQRLSLEIVAYEMLWPLRSYLDQDPSSLSPLLRQRVLVAETKSPEYYASLLQQRDSARDKHNSLRTEIDAIFTLSATGTAPSGLESTGNTIFNTPASYLGAPAISLPLFRHKGLPLGLQVIGFHGQDLEAIRIASSLEQALTPAQSSS